MFMASSKQECPLVLVVDDDSTVRLLARESLEQAGFKVEEAENGLQAFFAFESQRPQIVLLDLMMPEMDGFDVCLALRRLEGGDRVPILVMTSMDDVESINRAYEAGATDFITKPINWVILGHRVRYMMRASQVANELRKSETKNRAILNAVPDVMFRISKEGILEEVTGAKESTLCLSAGELPGKPLHEMMPAEVAEQAMNDISRVVSTGAGRLFEFPLQCPDALHHYEARIVACGEDEALCIVRDVSEQKWAEEQRMIMERQLRQAQKMEAIGTLAGGIAHDFNNILSAIIGYTELALHGIPAEKSACHKLHQVLRAGERAKGLVQQILSFSREKEEERKPLLIAPIIKETLTMLRASLPTTIEIRRHIKSKSGMVLADPSQMHQVLMNLCTNAAYAMREQGCVLKVSLIEEDLDDGTLLPCPDLKPGSYVKLTVSDTGAGMTQEVMERIFDPFFTTKGPGDGTGMGLSVVYGIVKSHGGFITVESEPGRGSSFDIYLPRIDLVGDSIEMEAVSPFLAGNKRILMVDDEAILERMGQEMLELLGYEVVARRSPLEALDVFLAQPDRFDLVITDQTMPHMTGAELARELMRIRPDIPVILCTGHSESITAEKAEAMGIRKFVMKPYELGQIARAISTVLEEGPQPQ